MKIKELIQVLEDWASPSLQESYDNSGLLLGDRETEISECLITLDVTEAVVQEAIDKKCNLIVAHHPIIFSGLKRLTGASFTERVVLKAIKADIAIYAIHTNLDNIPTGVNAEIGRRIGINDPRILSPMQGKLNKLVCFVPRNEREQVAEAMFNAGAGWIGNYSHASFNIEGTGTFKPEDGSNPTIGPKGQISKVEETKLEVLVPDHLLGKVISAMLRAHSYEEVAHDIIPLKNIDQDRGAGMIGELAQEVSLSDFLKLLKETFGSGFVKHTGRDMDRKVKKVAWCGGSGSFLMKKAEAQRADVYFTGDFKHHDYFEVAESTVLIDIGHYESEQFTKDLIAAYLTEKIPNFAPLISEENTNPVKHY